MRTFLNGILSFIASESLTDEEFATISDTLTQSYNEYVYRALRSVLQTREGVSSQLKKLKAVFVAKGVSVAEESAVKDPVSQIFVGSAL